MTPTERPRVTGEREREILEATLEILADVGYDRLTMDAVAARARASKATLYRRWSTKVALVIDALEHSKGPTQVPDTGCLRNDLLSLFCAAEGGLTDAETVATFASVLTAVARDPELAADFRARVVAPKVAASQQVWARARERGEVRPDADLSLLEPALAGIVLHRVFVMGEMPAPDLIARVVDQIILPAATAAPAPTDHTPTSDRRSPR